MKIYPAIDLLGGRAVQLVGGDPTKLLFSRDALEQAEKFKEVTLWLIDLNSALGNGSNLKLIKKILTKSPACVGGGIRTIEKANEMLEAGAEKIIIGTKAVEDPEFLKNFDPEKVIVALDCKKGKVCIDAWQSETGREVEDIGAKYYLVTNIDVEGRQEGLDFSFVENVLDKLPNVIISGGISSPEDVFKIKKMGAYGVVIGSALYSGKIKLEEVLNEKNNAMP
ncbi:MAG: 1-(5-phosphoribosyl)-5-[(5-phosphoribosylamino)methylideneamino] imidazole-4-carboxamide isomerase [archaeon]